MSQNPTVAVRDQRVAGANRYLDLVADKLAATEERLRDSLSRVEDAFYRVLRRAQSQGELATERDPRALARFLAGVVQGLRVMARLDPQEDRLRDVVETGLAAVAGKPGSLH